MRTLTYNSKANVDQVRRHAEVALQAIDRAERNDGEEREANQACAFKAGVDDSRVGKNGSNKIFV